ALEYEDIEQWQWVLNINLLGLVRMTKAFVPLLSAQTHSQIINIASQAGITPIPYMASYNASKAAVVSFSETMYLELAKSGIQVSV
ncbi:SDR family NAD(P)-dependent oxidoreductase, partial [Sanguibacter sp. 26GB23]